MQGAGNDFVVLDNRSLAMEKQELIELAPNICDRRFGVGADGIMALFPPAVEGANYTMFFRNPDGSDAGMCGNGARCMARFAHSLGFDSNHTFNVHNQIYEAQVKNPEQVCISFPIKASASEKTIDGTQLFVIHTGTEHVVTIIDQEKMEDEKLLYQKGQELRNHPDFTPKGTNANFICGIDNESLQLQTYERGVEDLTLACGTGAIASALIWHHVQDTHPTDNRFTVETKGGTLTVYFSFDPKTKKYNNIKLEGPSHFVFEGTYQL
jgi:diaminopimelate epimerase